MPSPLFYLFAILMIAGGVCVVSMKNPVSSAMGMIGSFIGIAALLIGLNAYFVGTLQVLVYAGAIMVLFIFIIMLLDLKKEENKEHKNSTLAAGVIFPLLFVLIMIPILQSVDKEFSKIDGHTLVAASENIPESELAPDSNIRGLLRGEKDFTKPASVKTATLPDVNLIGDRLYKDYNFPLQIVGVLLLVATIGCVALSKKLHGEEAPAGDGRMAKTLPKSDQIPTSPSLPVVEEEPTEKISEPLEAAVEEVISTPTEPVELPIEKEVETAEEEPEPAEEEEQNTVADVLPVNADIDEKRGLIYTARPESVDDLKVINGVGPVLEKTLNDFGIYTYKQVAEWSDDQIATFDELISFPGRITRDSWLDQAKELHAKKYS